MIRGLVNHAGTLYGVRGSAFVSIDSAGTETTLGAIASSGGPVDFASNLFQLGINDGSYLKVWSPATATLATAANYPGGDRIAFIDQRVVFLYRATQKFGWTALGDMTSIDVLDFASAEGSPDPLVAVLTGNRAGYLLGSTSTEIYDSTGDETVFRRGGTSIEYGCVAAHSAQKSANSVTWLGCDERGQAMVLRAQGFQPQRISTRAEEERFEGLDLSGAYAFTYTDGGQQFYCLQVPGAESTLVYDETFKLWHERAELVNGQYRPWRATCHAFAYGKHWFGGGDVLYTMDPDCHKFGADVLCRDRIAPVIAKPDQSRVFYPSLEIMCEKATNGIVMLRYSDDDGANWSDWKYVTAGETGQYKRRVRFNRLGSAFERVFHVRMTDDAPFNPIGVVVG